MTLIIVSDLHIYGPEDPLFLSLLSLLRDKTSSGDVVVLAGDIFDLFVGNKEVFMKRYQKFLTVIQECGMRGVQFHYIEGNHDFLIHDAFKSLPNLKVYSDYVHLELQGKRFLFLHGDTVDRTDYGYLVLRSFFRSPVMKALVTLFPGKLLDKMGKTASHESRKYSELSNERLEQLRKIYRNYAVEQLSKGCDFVVMGHCHDLDEMSFKIDGRIGQYINVGFPRIHGTYLTWRSGEDTIVRANLGSKLRPD